MSPELTSVVVGAAGLLAHALILLVWLRVPGRLAPVLRHAASAAVVHAASTVAAAYLVGRLPYWPNAAVFGFGVIAYLFAFCAVYKSVSLRILSRLLLAPGQRVGMAEIAQQFVLPEFRQRTRVMEGLGWIKAADDRLVITDKGRRSARRLMRLQALFGIRRSGLYGQAGQVPGGNEAGR